MIVRSFLTTFSLLIAFGAPLVSAPARAVIGADQVAAAADQLLEKHSESLRQQYGQSVRIEASVDRVDPRLQMADCSSPLEAELKSTRAVGRVNVQVRCEGDSPWSLYVPAAVNLYRPVVVLVAPVPRGEQLRADDLELREFEISRINGSYFTDIDAATGMVARRRLSPDQPLIAAYLRPPLAIHKGDAVILTASSEGLMVKMPGVALADGETGQQISVRNTQSDRVVEALVTGPGQVEVPM